MTWTTRHDRELKARYADTPVGELARQFAVDRKTIYRHAKRLGLTRPPGGHGRIPISRTQLALLAARGLTIREASAELQISRRTLGRALKCLPTLAERFRRNTIQRKVETMQAAKRRKAQSVDNALR